MKKINLITSSFLVAIVSATICAPAAMAAPIETDPQSSTFFTEASLKTSEALLPIDLQKLDQVVFSAEITLTDSKGSEVIEIDEASKSIYDAIEEKGHDPLDYRTSNDSSLEETTKLNNGETFDLFKSEVSGASETIILKAPVEKIETDDLYEGEEKIDKKGKDGKALKTIIKSKSLATDSKVNGSVKSTKKAEPDTVEEKLTVLETPKAKVILVGTKERPAPGVSYDTEASTSLAATPNRSTTQNQSAGSNAPTSSSSTATTQRSSGLSQVSRATTNVQLPSTSVKSKSSEKVVSKNDGANSSISSLAAAQVGKPYVWGATGSSSFDCSGLIYWLHGKQGKSVPRTTGAQWIASTPISGGELKAGDILWKPGHIAIYIGNGKTVHASSPKTGVIYGTASDMLSRGYKAGRL